MNSYVENLIQKIKLRETDPDKIAMLNEKAIK